MFEDSVAVDNNVVTCRDRKNREIIPEVRASASGVLSEEGDENETEEY